jgi:hypothetical protein
VDNEDPFESDSEIDDPGSDLPHDENEDPEIGRPTLSTPTAIGKQAGHSGLSAHRLSVGVVRRSSKSQRRLSARQSSPMPGLPGEDFSSARRFSSNAVPSIFSHSGVRTPPAILEAQQLLSQPEDILVGDQLEPIMESRQATTIDEDFEKPPSLYSQLPILIIVHYGLLALHNTTHDQVFYLYLVSWASVRFIAFLWLIALQQISVRWTELERGALRLVLEAIQTLSCAYVSQVN